MLWKEHSKSPGREARADGKPNLDFTKMNIMAAKRWGGAQQRMLRARSCAKRPWLRLAGTPWRTPWRTPATRIHARSGLTTAKEQPSFRAAHQTMVRKFDYTKKQTPPLPSDKSAKHAYGMPSSYRTMDVIRNCGPQVRARVLAGAPARSACAAARRMCEAVARAQRRPPRASARALQEPHMKHLVQGAYQEEWVRQNIHKETMAAMAGQGTYIPPVPTRAVIGHTIGAQKYLRPHHTAEEWKISKFKTVNAKVRAGVGCAGARARAWTCIGCAGACVQVRMCGRERCPFGCQATALTRLCSPAGTWPPGAAALVNCCPPPLVMMASSSPSPSHCHARRCRTGWARWGPWTARWARPGRTRSSSSTRPPQRSSRRGRTSTGASRRRRRPERGACGAERRSAARRGGRVLRACCASGRACAFLGVGVRGRTEGRGSGRRALAAGMARRRRGAGAAWRPGAAVRPDGLQ